MRDYDGTLEVRTSEIDGTISCYSNGKLIIEAYKDKRTQKYSIIDFSVENIYASNATARDYNTAMEKYFSNIKRIYKLIKEFYKQHEDDGIWQAYEALQLYIRKFEDTHCGYNRDGTLWVRVRV